MACFLVGICSFGYQLWKRVILIVFDFHPIAFNILLGTWRMSVCLPWKWEGRSLGPCASLQLTRILLSSCAFFMHAWDPACLSVSGCSLHPPLLTIFNILLLIKLQLTYEYEFSWTSKWDMQLFLWWHFDQVALVFLRAKANRQRQSMGWVIKSQR